MSKAYAKMRAEEKKKSSSASSQKKDKFQQAYEQGTEIYNQNRQNTIQDVRRLQQSLNATSGISGKTVTTARTYLDNLAAYRARLASLGMYGYDVARQYSALGGTAQMAQQIRGMSQAQYLQDVRFPQKYAGQGIGNINLAIQRLSNGNAQQKAEAKWLKQHRLDFVDTSQLQRAQKTNASAIERMTADRNQYHGAARSNWYDKNREQYDAAKAASGQLNRAIYERTYGDLLEKMPTALKNDLINVAGKAQAWEGETTEENRKNAQGYVQVRNDLKKAGYTDDQITGLMDYARRQYNATATAADIQKWADRIDGGFWNGAGASAASVPMNLAGGVAGYLDMAGQRLLGIKDPLTGTRKPIDYNSGANRFSNVSSGIRAAVGEHLNGFQNFLYQTGMSMGDFGLAALTGQAELLLSGSAAQQATQEAHLRGASDDQALFVGLLSGAAEAAFEHLSIENLRGIKNAVNKGMLGGKFLARAVGMQSLTEGSEEGLTTIANLISDAILMGDESQVNQQIRENILNGMSEKDATVSAWTEQAKGLLMDIAGGMLSGALIGGAQTGISAARFGAVNRGVHTAQQTPDFARYGAQARAVQSVYEAGEADAETFLRQFETAYNLGREGANIETAMNTPATAGLNEQQRRNAWLIGRDVGVRAGQITEDTSGTPGSSSPTEIGGVQNNGEAIRVRGSSERDAGASALGSVQQVESGTGSYQEGRSLGIGRSAKDGAAADLRYSEEVRSARDLGIENGAVIKNLRTVDESSYTPEMKQYAQEMAETGHKVTYVSGLIHAQDGPGGMITRARGMVNSNGDVLIQVDNERFTAIQIGKHEDGHLRIERGEIDLAATKDAVRESMGQERFDRAMQDYAEAYAGLDMTPDEIWEEIVCDAQGEMNIFEGTLMQNATERASNLIRETKAQTTAGETTQQRAPPEGGQKFSYAGIGAENADREALAQAQKLEDDGKDAETIRKETGWFRGADSKWRFEIDDSTARYRRTGDAIQMEKLSEYRLYQDLMEKMLNGTITGAEINRLAELDQVWKSQTQAAIRKIDAGNAKLHNFLQHDLLFAAYPQLRNVSVVFEDIGRSYGRFDAENNRITLSNEIRDSSTDFIKETLLHEVQHAIQSIEGFSKGTNLDAQKKKLLDKRNSDTVEAYDRVRKIFDSMPEEIQNRVRARNRAQADRDYDAAIEIENELLNGEYGELFTEYEDADFERASLLERQKNTDYDKEAYERYRNTAGEIEARDTASRRNMNQQQRRETPPDLGDRNTVFAEQKFSRELETDYEQALKNKDDEWARALVRKAAEDWGAVTDERGRAIPLFHGTHNFGFTEFHMNRGTRSDGLIYASTKQEVAANYAGPNHYAGVRQIGKGFAYATKSVNKIIDNASAFTGRRYKKATKQQLDNFRAKTERAAQKLNDRYNDLYEMFRDMAKWESDEMEFSNAIDRIGVILSLTADKDGWDDQTYVDETRYERGRVVMDVKNVQQYMQNHREEIIKSGWKDAMDLFSGYKLFDTIVDIVHGYTNILEGRPQITTSDKAELDSFSLRDAYSLQEGLDEQWDIGSYELYGKVGDKPYILDAEGENWTGLKAPDIMGDDLYHDTDEIAKKAKELGYTAAIIKNVYDGGVKADDYIFFSENQVKSADPVTYDEKGKPISLDERFSDKKDLRYSRETDLDQLARENRALQKETDELRKAVQKWKRETKRTERYSAREEDVRRSAKDLIKTLNSTADAAEITADMKALAEYIMNGENGEAASWLTVREMADRIADKVVGAEQVNIRGDVFNEYKRLTEILKGKTLHIDPEAVPDLQGYENLLEFNRANMGTMRLSAKEMKPGDKSVQDAYYEMIEAMPGWFPEDASTDAEMVANMLEVLDGLRPVYGMSDETSYHYDEAVTWAANDIIDRVLDESIRQMPKTFADRAQAKLDKERARLYQRIREVRAQGNERVERTKREYAARSKAAIDRMRQRQEKQIADLKAKQRAKEKNARERRGTTATWHKIQKIGAKFRQMAEHPAQAASKHAPRELAKVLQGVADVFYTENRRRSNQTVNAAIQNLAVQFDALKDTEQGIYYDPMLAELNRAAEKALLNVPANEMTPEQIDAVYRLLRAHMKNITSANKFVTGKWAKTIWETGRDWAREVDGASPIMKGWTGDFLNWQLRPDSFFKRISGFAKDSVGERVQKMFSDGTEKMLRIQQDAYYTFREFTESKQFDRLSKRGKGDLVDVGLKDADGKPVLLTRDMMLAVYMNLRNEQNLQAATYGGIEVPNFDEYYTGRTNTSYRHRTTTMNVGGETLELQNERRDLEHSLRSGELSEEAAEEARTRLQEIEDEIRQRADEIVGQMLKVRSNIESELTDYEKRFADAAAEWMRKSADYLNAETMAMYGIEKAQVPNYWPLHRDLSFVNTDMRTIADEINLENVGFLKERVQSSAPIMLAGFTFELENHTRRVSEYCGFAAVQRDFNKLYNTKLTREGSSLERKIRDKFGDEQRKMGASGQQYIDAYIASVSGVDKADATVFSLIRRNLPRATLTLNLRVAVSQLASMPTAAAEIGWGSAAKGLPRGLKTAFSRKAKAELARKNPWFWQRYRGEGGMREFADMREERNWLDRTWNKFAGMPVVRNLVNWCQDFDVFATASMWAMSEEWVKSNTDYKPGTEEFNRAVGEKYADVIRRTQPNYTVTERSGLLRDKREGYKLLTMYKTQSNQNLNVLYDANATLIKYKKDLKAGRNGVTKEDVKAAQRQFARAYTAVILGGSVSFAILRAGANAILHAMNSYRDDDDEVTLESTLNGILSETASAMAGMFAFGSAVYDAVHALVSGEKYYGLNESAIEALSNLAEQSMTIAQKAIDRDKDVEQKDVEKLVKNACNILGLPWNNARTIVEGVVNHVKDAQNGEFLSFEAGVNRTAAQEANRIIDGYLVGAGDRVKRAWNELLELKGDEEKAQSAMRSAVQGAYVAGDLTDKQAADLLKRYGGVKDKDAAAKVLEYQCERDTGVKYSKLKEAYLDGELTENAAKKALAKYGGKDSEAAEKAVTGWAAEKDTGFALDELKEAYLDGDISRERAIQTRVKYGGVEPEKAEEDALKWDVEKKFGIEYGVQNVQEAVAAGELSEADARAIWMEYGGKSEEDADELIAAANFKGAHSDVDLGDVTASRIQIYEQYAPDGTDAAEFMSYAAQIRKDQNAGKYPGIPDGKGGKKPYSVMDAVAEWINSLPISDGEKTALLLTYTNGKTTSLSRYNWS